MSAPVHCNHTKDWTYIVGVTICTNPTCKKRTDWSTTGKTHYLKCNETKLPDDSVYPGCILCVPCFDTIYKD